MRSDKVLVVENEGTEWIQGRIERLNQQDDDCLMGDDEGKEE